MKHTYRSIACLLAMILIMSLMPSAFAEGKPGAQDLQEIGSQIEYPKGNEYLAEYEYAEVRAPKGHSVLGFGSADHQGSRYTVLNGEKVKILAERKGYSCVIVLSQAKGRWVNTKYLIPLEKADVAEEKWVELSYSNFWKGKMTYHKDAFYENGHLMGYQIYSDQNAAAIPVYTRTDRFYDPEGSVTKTETIDRRTGKLLSTCMFTYDENGKLRSIEEYDTEGRLSSEDSYTTVEDEHTHISVDYDGAGRETRRFVWVTDADGNALRTETYYGDRELSSVQEVSYDDTGRATGGHNVIYMGDMGNLESDVSYEYDENGVLLSKTETFTSGYNAGNSVRTEYVHDEYGNTLEEHRIEDGKETNVTLRSFGFIKDGMMIRTSGETTPEPEM